jgi:hypothetical protein
MRELAHELNPPVRGAGYFDTRNFLESIIRPVGDLLHQQNRGLLFPTRERDLREEKETCEYQNIPSFEPTIHKRDPANIDIVASPLTGPICR